MTESTRALRDRIEYVLHSMGIFEALGYHEDIVLDALVQAALPVLTDDPDPDDDIEDFANSVVIAALCEEIAFIEEHFVMSPVDSDFSKGFAYGVGGVVARLRGRVDALADTSLEATQ